MDIKDAVKIMKEFNAKEYRGRALQVLIDYYESSQAKIKELETALDTAHKIFGSESDKLGAMIKELEDKLTSQRRNYEKRNILL